MHTVKMLILNVVVSLTTIPLPKGLHHALRSRRVGVLTRQGEAH